MLRSRELPEIDWSLSDASMTQRSPCPVPAAYTPAEPGVAPEGIVARTARAKADTGANLGFEAKLWQAADALRNNMDAAEYKHVVLGLIFLKYISDAFEEKHAELEADRAQGADPEDPDEYRADDIFWVPKEARWSHLKAQRQAADDRHARRRRDGRHRARQPVAQGRAAQGLRPARPRQAAPRRAHRPRQRHRARATRPTARRTSSAASTSTSSPSSPAPRARRAASSTRPAASSASSSRCSRPTRAASTTPAAARAACSSRARSSSRRTAAGIGDICIYGQESNHTTWRLAKMNLAIRGIDAQIAHGDTFHNDRHPDLKADYVLANPPFNDSDWGGELLQGRQALEVRRAAGRQRQLRLGPALHPPPRADRDRRLRARQRLDVAEPVGRGRDPQGDRRGRPRRLHGRAAGPALLLDADPGLPLVPRPRQEQRPLPRPPRRDALHRRPQDGHAWSTGRTAS